MCIRTRRTIKIKQELVGRYAQLTGDDNSIHFDMETANEQGYTRPIAHGMLIMMFATTLLNKKDVFVYEYDMQFIKPIFIGSEIELRAEENKKRHLVELSGFIAGEKVVKGKARLTYI